MVEQKKGPKQATMFSFFSPKKPGQESDENTVESEAKSVGAKRPRVASPAAKTEANSTDKTELEDKKKTTSAKSKAKTKAKTKSKGKTKASPKAKAKKKKQPVRFTSPHAVDEDEDDDLEDDEDVFNTPEAKRARAELETGGDIVPAGALISDDAVVEETDIVDVSEEDAAANGRSGEDAVAKDGDEFGGVVDLTATIPVNESPKAAEYEETKEDKSAKSPMTRAPVAKTSKTAAKTQPKRQRKVKEKAAAAEVKPAPIEPLDPAIQARVDTYKLKTDELTRQYFDLLHSKQESDTVMQDIYGAGLDCNLDVIVDQEKSRQALAGTWQNLRTHAHSSSSADSAALPSAVEFPHEVKCLIVKSIQGRTACLSAVTNELLALFKKNAERVDADMETTDQTCSSETNIVDNAACLVLEMEIKMLAQRTPHGVRPAKANLFEDTSADALWVWEVGSLEKYFGDDAQKVVKRMRKHRKRLGQQLKTLARVVQLLHQNPVDEAKVSAEEAKVAKFGFAVDAELQKAKDRDAKEQEKRNAVEEKKRHQLERQQAKEAKDEEKQKRRREEEEKKKGVSAKRQKMMQKFFQAPSTNNAETSESAIDITDDQELEKTSCAEEGKSAKIARMDAAISFLGSSEDASSSPDVVTHQSIFSSLKGKRDASNMQTDKPAKGWSAQRHRDKKLGGMKLLQFYENNRPAYYGTFSTRTPLFRGGRRPLVHYPKFDYSVDSDDEWEEEEPGESLSDDDNDGEESDDDNLDYEDKWLAYEDEVDYMDDVDKEDDTMELDEGSSSTTKHKLPSQLQKKRVKAKPVKAAKLEPQIIGPFWCSGNRSNSCADTHFSGFAIELLCEPVFESTLIRKAREYEEEQKRVEAARQEQQRKKEQQQEQEKLKAQEKEVEEAKEKAVAATATSAGKQAAEKPKVAKRIPEKPKATLQKGTPQKANGQKTAAKHPAATPSPAKSTSAAACSSSSPAKQIDSYFKKVTGPVPVPAMTQQPKPTDEQKSKDGSVEIISVD